MLRDYEVKLRQFAEQNEVYITFPQNKHIIVFLQLWLCMLHFSRTSQVMISCGLDLCGLAPLDLTVLGGATSFNAKPVSFRKQCVAVYGGVYVSEFLGGFWVNFHVNLKPTCCR